MILVTSCKFLELLTNLGKIVSFIRELWTRAHLRILHPRTCLKQTIQYNYPRCMSSNEAKQFWNYENTLLGAPHAREGPNLSSCLSVRTLRKCLLLGVSVFLETWKSPTDTHLMLICWLLRKIFENISGWFHMVPWLPGVVDRVSSEEEGVMKTSWPGHFFPVTSRTFSYTSFPLCLCILGFFPFYKPNQDRKSVV